MVRERCLQNGMWLNMHRNKIKEINIECLNYVSDSLEYYRFLSVQEVVLSPHGVLGITDITLVQVDKKTQSC